MLLQLAACKSTYTMMMIMLYIRYVADKQQRELYQQQELHEKNLQQELELAGLGLESTEEPEKADSAGLMQVLSITKVKDVATTLGT